MGFFIEDNYLSTDSELIEKRKKIIKRKKQLLQQFRNYVLDYLRKEGETLEVEYGLLNNNPNVRFEDLKIGDKFIYETIYFKFNLQKELTTNYLKKSYGQITKLRVIKLYDELNDKTYEDVSKGCDLENIKPRYSRRFQINLSMISDFERQKIIERIQFEVDSILRYQIFEGKLTFDDPEFKKLVKTNAYLERELREIDSILKPKDNSIGFEQTKKR